MADKLKEQLNIPLIELVTNPEFITTAYKCLGSDSPDVIGLVDMPQAVECKAKLLNLFKSQVKGLTVIGDEEIEVAYADGLEHGAPFTKIAKAQLQADQRQLGGME